MSCGNGRDREAEIIHTRRATARLPGLQLRRFWIQAHQCSLQATVFPLGCSKTKIPPTCHQLLHPRRQNIPNSVASNLTISILTLIGALVVTHAMLRRLTSWRCIIIIILTENRHTLRKYKNEQYFNKHVIVGLAIQL